MDKVLLFMEKLHITEEEAKDLIEYDRRVDKGEKTEYDLTNAQQREINKYMRADRTPKDESKKRAQKEDVTKEGLIADLADFLKPMVQNIEIANKSRQIKFTLEGESFDLTLIRHNKK